jgi:multidrug efflux system outer membrane protein
MSSKCLSTALAALLLIMAGCAVIPAYEQPELPVEKAWSQDHAHKAPANPGETGTAKAQTLAADLAWQDYFKSETLQQIIQLALDNNRDLRVAVLNIEQARAAYRIQEANTLPVVSGNAGLSRQGVAQDNSATGRAYTSDTTMSASLGVTAYELDFFGRVKNMNQSALETFLATEAAALSTRIALIGQTADAYLSLLADRKLLGLAKDTCQAQKETYDVIQNQFEVGSATQLDLSQAATAVESARVSIARYTRQLAQAENALTLLAGISVKALLNSKETIDKIRFLDNLPAGLSSDVLLARPDIRAAEHRLKAANADIGAARAALYPVISLTGALGFASQGLTSLFNGDSLSWNLAPSLTIPIFNRQGLNASLEAAETGEKIALATYEGAVQTAFREVADQLDARKTYRQQLEAQTALVDASHQAYTLSKARYDNGIDNFLTVLDSQRTLFAAQQGAITIRQAYLSNLVNLYKVLGGGQI